MKLELFNNSTKPFYVNTAPQLLDTINNWRCSFSMGNYTAEEKLQATLRYLNGKGYL